MIYKETYKGLCHGTDKESAKVIIKNGFELRGDASSWCGKGVYFYDIKKKAWWAAKRQCNKIKKDTRTKAKPTVLFADIIELEDNKILDMRAFTDLCAFEKGTQELFGEYKMIFSGITDETERKILLRSLLISFYANQNDKKLIIGHFRQRPQPQYEHAIEFSNSLDMIFGIETIYCVKDKAIIQNICEGGSSNE